MSRRRTLGNCSRFHQCFRFLFRSQCASILALAAASSRGRVIIISGHEAGPDGADLAPPCCDLPAASGVAAAPGALFPCSVGSLVQLLSLSFPALLCP